MIEFIRPILNDKKVKWRSYENVRSWKIIYLSLYGGARRQDLEAGWWGGGGCNL